MDNKEKTKKEIYDRLIEKTYFYDGNVVVDWEDIIKCLEFEKPPKR